MPRTVTMDGRTEDEYRLDINRAIADTEDEIFREAMGDEELDNDGDNSLEEMGEGPGGDHLDDEDVVEEYDTEVDPEADQVLQAEPGEQEADEGEEEGEEAEEGEQEGYEQPPYQEPQRGVPSYRVREESERARVAEERAIALERELAQMRGRMDELSTRVNQPARQQQPAAPPPEPDMFTDPEGWKVHQRTELTRQVRAEVQQQMGVERQQQQMQVAQRVEASFGAAANSERRYEFLDAYDRLTHLDPNDPRNRETVIGITQAGDPAQALFDWFDSYNVATQRPPRGHRPAPRQQEPQHEVRLPPNMGGRRGPPSLNSMGGGGPGQRVDPDMLDDSDAAVFRYATR